MSHLLSNAEKSDVRLLGPPVHQKLFSSRSIEGKQFSDDQVTDNEAIAIFVRSKEAYAWISEGLRRSFALIPVLTEKVDQLAKAYPNAIGIKELKDNGHDWLKKHEVNVKSDLCFFLFGVFPVDESLLTVEEDKELKSLQVKIFKQWLRRYQIFDREGKTHDAEGEEQLIKEGNVFCQKVSSQSIKDKLQPLFLELLERNRLEEDDKEAWEDLLDEYVLGDISEYSEYGDVSDKDDDEDDETVDANNDEIEKSELAQQFRALLKDAKTSEKKFFSRDAILKLFLRVTGQWNDLRSVE